MAWSYFAVCISDFILFPLMSASYQAAYNLPYHEWHPLTLQGGGLYHIAMGAIVGVTSWQRSQEKIAVWQTEYGGRTRTYSSEETVTSGRRPNRPTGGGDV